MSVNWNSLVMSWKIEDQAGEGEPGDAGLCSSAAVPTQSWTRLVLNQLLNEIPYRMRKS